MSDRGRIHVPWGLLGPALLIAVVFGAAHALGLRDSVSVLSGTAPPGGGEVSAFGGVVYVAAWLAMVAIAPILVIAAAILTAGRAALWRREGGSGRSGAWRSDTVKAQARDLR